MDEPTTPPANTPSGSNGDATKQPWEVAIENLTANLESRQDNMLKVFTKKLERVKPSGETPTGNTDPPAAATPAAASNGESLAYYKLGAAMDGVPEAAREKFEAMLEDGKSPGEVLGLVNILREIAPGSPAGASHSPVAPQGRAPPSPTRTSPNHPKTTGEYVALAAKARTDPSAAKAWEALKADDTFDPESLT